MYRIASRIFVEKASQKNIVIGGKGKMLKQIVEESRISIEGFLERKVFLELCPIKFFFTFMEKSK